MTAYGGVKFAYARKLAASLCYVGLVRHDSMEIRGFSKISRRAFFPPAGGIASMGSPTASMALEAGGVTDYQAVVREFIGSYPQRGLLIVISDFLDDKNCERALQYLADFGHELMLLQVWADEDRTPPWSGELELQDAETGPASSSISTTTRANATPRAFDDYCSMVESMALRSGGRYAGISTGQSLESVVFGDLVRMRGIA